MGIFLLLCYLHQVLISELSFKINWRIPFPMNWNYLISMEITHLKGWLKLNCRTTRRPSAMLGENSWTILHSFPSFYWIISSFLVLELNLFWGLPQIFSRDNKSVIKLLFWHWHSFWEASSHVISHTDVSGRGLENNWQKRFWKDLKVFYFYCNHVKTIYAHDSKFKNVYRKSPIIFAPKLFGSITGTTLIYCVS